MEHYLAPNLTKNTHAFFGRQGGVSKGIYESLNFNFKSKDTPENIAANLSLIGKFYNLPAKNVVRLYQDHTNKAVFIDQPSQYQIHADGMVTNKPNLILGVTTADCTPVLFADYEHGLIGAAHAGWRGVLYGVIENTLEVMLQYGAKLDNIAVAAGPCLQKQNFEVKNDMRQLFIDYDHEMQNFFEPRDDFNESFLCDIEGIIKFRLEKAGINNHSFSGIDTYSEPKKFFSYRRNSHQGLINNPGDFPIQLSTICL